jgi:ferredoxin
MVVDFLAKTPLNYMGENFGEEKMWGTPLVGFAAASDPIFKRFKALDACGPEHWLPEEIFDKAFPGTSAKQEDLTVVSWVLPQTEETKYSLRQEKEMPSERWSRSRIIGEKVNEKLRVYMASTLTGMGYEAVAPVNFPEWTRLDSMERVYTSTWSERHTAYACGLGTFGLDDALITPLGKAMRLGSIVVKAQLEPDARPYDDIHAYCLHFAIGKCNSCISRCPAGAISSQGHDKIKCRDYLHSATPTYIKEHYNLIGYSCGFCQTKVPCENGIPKLLCPNSNK